MKKLNLTLFCCLLVAMAAWAQSSYDLNRPFGFCTVSSRTDKSNTFNITGGGGYIYNPTDGSVTDIEGNAVDASKVKVLKKSDVTSDDIIKNAIKSSNYSVIIFDGSEGDFTINQQIPLDNVTGKTLLGINNARLCTKFVVNAEIREAIAASGAHGASTDKGTGGTLSNGVEISEAAEFLTRQAIIDKTGDSDENYRKSGIFKIPSTASNIIIRNIKFVGPGAIDAGAYDLISATGSKHVWVDHCEFTDGMDGNFDITNSADFYTVSWCTFSYTERSYMHQNTNLVGSSDDEPTGYLNTTFANNIWGAGCKQRMPMARVGKIHMLNNYYNCAGSNLSLCINPRANSEFLVEGNYFASGITSSSKLLKVDGATACTIANNNVASASIPSSTGSTVSVPYSYTVNNASTMKNQLEQYAGATLFVSPSKNTNITATVDGEEASFSNDSYTYSFDAPDAKAAYSVVLTLPAGATVSAVTGATLVSGTTYSITAPAEGSTVSATFTITSADGTVNHTYTIVLKSISNVKYADIKTSGNTTIYYWNSKSGSTTKSDFKVLTGSYKTYSSGSEISYGGSTYKYGLKMETNTEAQLKISEKSNVVFVFDTASKRFYLNGSTCTTDANGVYFTELESGTYTIKKQDSPNLVAVYVTPSGSSPQPTLYTVTYNANGHGTCSTANWTQTSEGQSTTLPSVTANTGYRFMGWATSSVAVIAEYNAGASYTPISDVTLYAVYQQEQQGGGDDGDVATLFSWESTNNTVEGVTVTGGTAMGNLASSNGIYVMKLADKPSGLVDGSHVIVTLSNGNTFAEGDVITVTGFYSKDSNTETSFGVIPGENNSKAILGTDTDWPNNYGRNYGTDGFTQVTHTYILTSAFNDQTAITLTRGSKSGTGLYLTKVEVTREVSSLPSTVTATVASTRKFGSFSSLYNVDFGTDENAAVQAYTVKVKDATSVVLTRHYGVLPAGEGVVLYAPGTTKSQEFYVASGDYAALADNDMIGVPVATNVDMDATGGRAYVVNSDAFKPLSVSGTIAAGKAYIRIPSSLGGAKAISMMFNDDNATGISNHYFFNTNPSSMKIYNLQGIEVKNPVRGRIYIINNKKCIFK